MISKDGEMKTIETQAMVSDDGTLTAKVPPDIKPGEHHTVILIDESQKTDTRRLPLQFPVDHYGAWPQNVSLRREDIYGDDGR